MSAQVRSRIPAAGPILLEIPGVSNVRIAAGTTGAAVKFTWPMRYVVSGLWLSERLTASPVVTGNINLQIIDDMRNLLTLDGSGALEDVPALALVGRSPRWQPFRRVVRAGQRWVFRIRNSNGAQDIIPQLYFRLEEQTS